MTGAFALLLSFLGPYVHDHACPITPCPSHEGFWGSKYPSDSRFIEAGSTVGRRRFCLA